MTLREAIDRYLADVRVGRSAATYWARRTAIGRWLEYLELRDEDPDDVADLTEEHLLAFARWVSATRLARDTADLMISGVLTFYAFLARETIRRDLPLEPLRLRVTALRGRHPRRMPRVPTDDVVERIAAAAQVHRPRGHGAERAELIRLRNIAMIELLRGSGVRVSEVCTLRRGALRGGRRAMVTGKGDKQRMIVLTDAAEAAIAVYHRVRGDREPLRELPVFARHDPRASGRCQPLDTDTVRRVIRVLAIEAGVGDAGVTPHRFRAWFATHVGAATGDLAAVQELLGHEDPATTRRYLAVADDRLVAVHGRAFPAAAPA